MASIPDTGCDLLNPESAVGPGDTIDASLRATIQNTSSTDERVTVVGRFVNQTFGEQTVTVTAGGSETVTLAGTVTAPSNEGEFQFEAEITNTEQLESDTDDGTTGGDTGGDTGGGGTGGDDTRQQPSVGNVSIESIDYEPKPPLEGDTVSLSVTLRNNASSSIDAGIRAFANGRNEGESIRRIPAGERFTINKSIGSFSQGTHTARAVVTDGTRTGESRSVSIDVTAFTDPISGGGGGDDSDSTDGGGGGGGGGGSSEPQCPDGKRYSSSIGECIPDCPQGQAFFPGLGCADVTGEGVTIESGVDAGVYGGARRAVFYRGGRVEPPASEEDDRQRTTSRRRSGSQ